MRRRRDGFDDSGAGRKHCQRHGHQADDGKRAARASKCQHQIQSTPDRDGFASLQKRNPPAVARPVRQWRFTPTLLNGQPVPVVMTVTVNFQLD